MRVSVERLRIWLLVGAGLLVLVVVGFLGVARWRARRLLTEIPSKLGADVRQEANAFTYSQTVKGRTVFTVHAAKAIQHKDGKYTLHDVGIAVYGQSPLKDGPAQAKSGAAQQKDGAPQAKGQPERVDRIYGKEFELDQANGVVKAVGEVHLDLEAAAAGDAKGRMDYATGKDLKAPSPMEGQTKASQAAGAGEAGRGESGLIHVKTSNLVYLKNLGMAATEEEVEFEYNGLTGHARGAEYNADTGVLRLDAAVKVSGLEHGRPILLTASQADLDRVSHKALLNDAEYLTVNGERGDGSARQLVKARHAVVQMREGGGVERIDGDAGVSIRAGEGIEVSGTRGEALLNDAGKPVSARVWGDVRYTVDEATRKAEGGSKEARLGFDRGGQADRIVLDGGVQLKEQVPARAAAQKAAAQAQTALWSSRDLSAATVEMNLESDAQGRAHPRDARATGGARLKVMDPVSGGGQRVSSMAAEVLTARFATSADGVSRIEGAKGSGSTRLEQTTETGVQETSTGDELDVRFRDTAKGTASQIASAVQTGHVVVTRRQPGKGAGAAPETDRATAERASYDGGPQVLTLSGGVQLVNSDGQLWTDRMLVEQRTGDATAEGSVKASLRQSQQQEAVHVLADRAEMKKATGVAIFHGRAARLWQQGGSQVEAPVIEFNQKSRTLAAHGEGAGAAGAVRTVMVRSGTATETARPAVPKRAIAGSRSSVVRVASREMRYADAQREAVFSGGVRVESSDGVMTGDRAVAQLEAAGKRQKESAAAGFMAGGLESVTMTGQIEITQPGRRATGERLVYTAGDGLVVLTGSRAAAPRVVDQSRGMITGEELSFRAADESVVISNGEKGGSGPRVHTETQVKRDR